MWEGVEETVREIFSRAGDLIHDGEWGGGERERLPGCRPGNGSNDCVCAERERAREFIRNDTPVLGTH